MMQMTRKAPFKDSYLELTLNPEKELPPTIQKKLWQNLLTTDFQSSIGKPEIDHVVTGSGESHIEYQMDGFELLLYEYGRLSLRDRKISIERTSKVERILTAFFQTVHHTANKKLAFSVSGLVHLILSDGAVKRFLRDSIGFRATPKFGRVFGNHAGLKSFLLRISDSMNLAVISPVHIDFVYHGTVNASPSRKPFVRAFVTTSMNHLKLMRRYAQ